MFIQPDLGKTLSTIAREGADVFYRGSLARLTASFYEKQGGLLRFDDLASFEADETEPIKTIYREYEVYQSAPNSQGIVMLIALNILEEFDLKNLGHNSPNYLHVITETLKLAFADRDEYIGDPNFVSNMPIEVVVKFGLLSPVADMVLYAHATPNKRHRRSERGGVQSRPGPHRAVGGERTPPPSRSGDSGASRAARPVRRSCLQRSDPPLRKKGLGHDGMPGRASRLSNPVSVARLSRP